MVHRYGKLALYWHIGKCVIPMGHFLYTQRYLLYKTQRILLEWFTIN